LIRNRSQRWIGLSRGDAIVIAEGANNRRLMGIVANPLKPNPFNLQFFVAFERD